MAAKSSHDVTGLLLAWGEGDRTALDRLIPLVHDELHRMAHRYMSGEREGHTLQTTALINEAYLRLVDSGRMHWQNRAHFFAVSAEVMRRILVDFARAACPDDEELCGEVESLLALQSKAENFIEKPALEIAAKAVAEDHLESVIGQQISNYKIVALLGQGGMGEVYLAQDMKLGRKVAIKFLPQCLAADERARKRLIREAQAAAKLEHPNICGIHEVGEEDERRFIVMPYVE